MDKIKNLGDDPIKSLRKGCYSVQGDQSKIMIPCDHIIIDVLKSNESNVRFKIDYFDVKGTSFYKLDKHVADQIAKFILDIKEKLDN